MRRIVLRLILAAVYITAIAALKEYGGVEQTAAAIPVHQPARLAAVERLPDPALPDFIESITPRANTTVAVRGQISIQFRQPLVALGRIDQVDNQDVLKYFSITPQIEGKFRFANPNLVVFEPVSMLPQTTRLQVVIKQGLTDLAQNRLQQDVRWSFEVEPLKLDIYVASPVALDPMLNIYTSALVTIGELKRAVTISAADASPAPAFDVINNEERPQVVAESAAPSSNPASQLNDKDDDDVASRNFRLKFKEPLKRAKQYAIRVETLLPAEGNLPLAETVQKSFSTFFPLQASVGSSNYTRVFASSVPVIKFNNPLAEGAAKFIEVSPQPRARNFLFEQGDTIILDERYLKAQTLYRVTLKKGLKDIFDQTLKKTVTFDLHTGDYRGGLWVPEGITVVQPSLAQKLTVHYVNVPTVQYAWRALGIKDLQKLMNKDYLGSDDFRVLLPPGADWQILPGSTGNERAQHDYALPDLLQSESGVLAYGFAADLKERDIFVKNERFGMLMRTDLGVHSQWLPVEGMVQVYQLADGTPVPAATVNVYTADSQAPCATGSTDAQGGVQWNSSALTQCISETQATEGRFTATPHLLIEVKQGTDWTFAFSHINQRRFYGNYSGDYEDGGAHVEPPPTYARDDWSGKNESRGVLFSDRFMYKPGETATLNGMVRFLRAGKLSTP